jgi:hypothetical protein
MILHAQQRQMLRDSFKRRRTGGSAAPAPRPATSPARPTPAPVAPTLKAQMSATTFHRAARPVMLQSIADKMGRTPDERAKLMQFFQQGLAAYHKEARRVKHPDDVALALAFFIATNYAVCQPAHEPTEAQIEQLTARLRPALTGMPQIRGATDRQKQALFETLVTFGVFTLAGYQQGVTAKDQEMESVFTKLATQNLQTILGVSPDQMRFTATGLEIGPGQ